MIENLELVHSMPYVCMCVCVWPTVIIVNLWPSIVNFVMLFMKERGGFVQIVIWEAMIQTKALWLQSTDLRATVCAALQVPAQIPHCPVNSTSLRNSYHFLQSAQILEAKSAF